MTMTRMQVGTQYYTMAGDHFVASFRNPGTAEVMVEVWLSPSAHRIGPAVVGPQPVSPEQILEVIAHEIATAPDSLAAAGEWITRLTTGITEAIREEDRT